MQLNPKNLILSILLATPLLACGNPHSDRIIVLPDQHAPKSLSKPVAISWQLTSINARQRDNSDVRYQVTLKPTLAADNTIESISGEITQIGSGDVIVAKILMTPRLSFQSETQSFFRDIRSESPLLQFNIQNQTKDCRFSWQTLVDTNEDFTNLIYDEVKFEGQCL